MSVALIGFFFFFFFGEDMAKKRMDRRILNLSLGLMNPKEFMCKLCVVK